MKLIIYNLFQLVECFENFVYRKKCWKLMHCLFLWIRTRFCRYIHINFHLEMFYLDFRAPSATRDCIHIQAHNTVTSSCPWKMPISASYLKCGFQSYTPQFHPRAGIGPFAIIISRSDHNCCIIARKEPPRCRLSYFKLNSSRMFHKYRYKHRERTFI